MAEVMTSPTARVLDRRLWRIDQGVRELVAECYRTRTGRTKMIWLVPEASLRGLLWVEVVGAATADPSVP
jgi:hypothetical protein